MSGAMLQMTHQIRGAQTYSGGDNCLFSGITEFQKQYHLLREKLYLFIFKNSEHVNCILFRKKTEITRIIGGNIIFGMTSG
jgi:hypothetical protein